MKMINWFALSYPASEAALWALQHCVQLRPDVGPGGRPADRQLSLHLADEQRAHTGLWARRGPANHPESGLAHQRPPAAAEAPVLLRPGQQHRLRCVGATKKHEEGRQGHRVQHAAAGGGELPACTNLRHHRGQDELLWYDLQEGDRKRQVSPPVFLSQSVDIYCSPLWYNIDRVDAGSLFGAPCFPCLKSFLSWSVIIVSYLTFPLKRLYVALETIL